MSSKSAATKESMCFFSGLIFITCIDRAQTLNKPYIGFNQLKNQRSHIVYSQEMVLVGSQVALAEA